MESLSDDHLLAPIAGPWAEEKYRLVECYARIFGTSMKKEWDLRVYIDLFAGAGRARIRGSRRLVETAALRVLSISDPFDRYIFCELDSEKLTALESRIGTTRANRNAVCLNIDSNADVARIMAQLPAYHAGQKVLTFGFVDPFRIRHLEFSTIRRLADRFVDFLVLLPTGMDPGRNEEPYSHQENTIVSAFTGKSNWREDRRQEPGIPFGDFVALEFGRSMQDLEITDCDFKSARPKPAERMRVKDPSLDARDDSFVKLGSDPTNFAV